MVKKYWGKKSGQTPNATSPCLILVYSSNLQDLLPLLTATHTASSIPCFSFPGNYPTPLTSLKPWDFQVNVGLTLKASHYALSKPSCAHIHNTCLASEAFLNHGGRYFFTSLRHNIWPVLPCSAACLGWSLPLFLPCPQLHLQKLSFVVDILGAENSSGLFLSQYRNLAGWVLP